MSDLQRELSQANAMLLRADYINLRDYEVNDLKERIANLEMAVDVEKSLARMTLLLATEVA